MKVVGIDEVGRGCWAGPLVAAAVLLKRPISGLADSKVLTRLQRQRLAEQIEDEALAIGIGWVWPEAIDSGGITKAVKDAMTAALQQIDNPYDEVIIDGNFNYLQNFKGPSFEAKIRAIIKADGLIPSVSAASIIAKVARDNWMRTQATTAFPEYGFDKHVGYGTVLHQQMLAQFGATPLHRKSFKPIATLLEATP